MSVQSRKVVWGLVAGAALTGVAIAQQPGPAVAPVKTVATPEPPVSDALRADPLGAMLANAKTAYGGVRDYICTFTRQERVNGALSAEQVGEMKVRVKPLSVSIRFARPEAVAGMEMIYMSGSRLGKLSYRPAGAKGLNGTQLVALDDRKVMAENRHMVTELGVGPLLDLLAGIATREKAMGNPVEVFTSDYQFAGRNVTRYEIFTRRPHTYRYAYLEVVYVDKETKLPLRFEAYDTPKPGLEAGELLESYSYTNIKVNVGLGDSAFDR